jgi:hypothetical protein
MYIRAGNFIPFKGLNQSRPLLGRFFTPREPKMFYIDICKDINEIQNLRTDYLAYLRGPQEAWLEEQVYVRNPDFYVFGNDDQRIGYCCV